MQQEFRDLSLSMEYSFKNRAFLTLLNFVLASTIRETALMSGFIKIYLNIKNIVTTGILFTTVFKPITPGLCI